MIKIMRRVLILLAGTAGITVAAAAPALAAPMNHTSPSTQVPQLMGT